MGGYVPQRKSVNGTESPGCPVRLCRRTKTVTLKHRNQAFVGK
jgi:hypothetical protein